MRWTKRERTLLELRYPRGRYEPDPLSFEEIARLMGVSAARAQQIHRRALGKLGGVWLQLTSPRHVDLVADEDRAFFVQYRAAMERHFGESFPRPEILTTRALEDDGSLDVPLTLLRLSPESILARAIATLQRYGRIYTLRQVADRSDAELLQVRRFGPAYLAAIREEIARRTLQSERLAARDPESR